nr:sulfotransferase [Marinobacter sp. JH2]
MDRILISNTDFTDLNGGKENQFVFGEVTQAALLGVDLKKTTLTKYRALKNYAWPKVLVDQSHPNIWQVENLLAKFPEAKFVGMVRDPLSVTYSTLHHSGVASWAENYENFPVPNRFLGVSDENIGHYKRYSLAQRSALRWAVHMERLDNLKRKYPDSVFIMNYEQLCVSPEVQLHKLSDFLGCKNDFKGPVVETSALYKKNKLKEKSDVLLIVKGYFSSNPLPDEKYIPLSDYFYVKNEPEK